MSLFETTLYYIYNLKRKSCLVLFKENLGKWILILAKDFSIVIVNEISGMVPSLLKFFQE